MRLTASWAAAHQADQIVVGNAAARAPVHGIIKVNRVGQDPDGLIGYLQQFRPAQNVNYMLPGDLHFNHRTLVHATNRVASAICFPIRTWSATFLDDLTAYTATPLNDDMALMIIQRDEPPATNRAKTGSDRLGSRG